MIKDKYTIEEVSLMSGLTTRTIRNYLKDGLVHASKEDGKWVFTIDEFTNMLASNYVRAAVKAKINAPVFDFLADEKKKTDSVCMAIDRIMSEEEAIPFIERLCSLQEEIGGIDMRLEKRADHVRIILSGAEPKVRALYVQL